MLLDDTLSFFPWRIKYNEDKSVFYLNKKFRHEQTE